MRLRVRDQIRAGAAVALACSLGVAPAAAAGTWRAMTVDDLAALPVVQVTVPTPPGHSGPAQHTFEGPLLWTVLDRAGAIESGRERDQVRQIVVATGRDGYTAVLGLGEIAPNFEGKQVVVAERMDGQPLGPDHLRLVVPGDVHGGRSVHDLAGIAVVAPREAERRR